MIKTGLQTKNSTTSKKSQLLKNLKKPEAYKPFLIIILLGIIQQFSGMTILRAYVVKIFNGIFQTNSHDHVDELKCDCDHVAKEAYIAAIIIGITRLISSLLLSKLLYHFKRRHLYFVSGKSNFKRSYEKRFRFNHWYYFTLFIFKIFKVNLPKNQ